MTTAAYSDLVLYRRLLRQARPYWLHIAGAFLLSLLSTPLALLTPLPLKLAVDGVLGSQPIQGVFAVVLPPGIARSDTALLALAAGLAVAIAVLSQAQTLGSSLLRTYAGESLVLDFRARLFRHVQRLSLSYHDARGTADTVYRIQHDAPAIQHIVVDGVIPLVTAGFTLAAMIAVTVQLDWQLALVALAVSPVLFLISRAYKQRLRNHWRETKKLESSALSVVQEVLAAVRVVKAFGQEDREQERFVRRAGEGIVARVRVLLAQGGFSLLVALTTALGTAGVLFVGVLHVKAGTLTLGNLLLIMGYVAQLYAPLQTLSKSAASLQSALASAERAFSLLDEAPDVVERRDALPLKRALGAIAFQHVSFAYRQDRPALQDISFEIGPGAHVGVVGTTGAGKTTLVSLLTRFYDPMAGRILLDGVDLRAYRLADLRNQFAIVLQEPVLFSTSIAQNIAYARPGASADDVIAAAIAASAHEFIMRLPEGYETLVGDRGMRLSGGERQRISLARAFLKDAPILILDEPTSSVDVGTEATILEAMEQLMRGRTAFLITHRLSLLKSCHVLLTLENGRLAAPTSGAPAAHRRAPALDALFRRRRTDA
ncbi:MAG: ABC transporter ATP-binding protein [Chloroflexi bacterium]|nr:ABC transporter ATP-binding protein [Chloroflexota bacterium]